MDLNWDGLQQYLTLLAISFGIALLIGMILLALIWRRLMRINLPPDAGFIETIRAVPFLLVVALDLMDFALDIFAAPVVWIILGRLNLTGLRGLSTVEALIPGTQVIPTLTASWIAIRLFRIRPD